MKHWRWISLAFLAVILTVVATSVPRFSGGGSSERAYAHIITATPEGPNVFHAEIDVVTTNDGGPCKSIDASADVAVGAKHDIAVCLTSPGTAMASFQFEVLYNPDLNSCVDKDCAKTQPCTEDDMPDLNEGASLGQGSKTSPYIGGGWDCSGFGKTEPSCAGGLATISCGSLAGPFPPTGPSVSFPIFAVTFTAIAGGTDNLSLANVATYDSGFAPLGSCNPTLFGEPTLTCFGATVGKTGTPPAYTATPTATRTATPTATRCPNDICPTSTPMPKAWTKTPTPTPTGTPTPAEPGGPPPPPPPPPPPSGGTMPQVVPPATGSGPDGIPWASTAVWLLAAAGAVSASLGGLYLRRAGHR